MMRRKEEIRPGVPQVQAIIFRERKNVREGLGVIHQKDGLLRFPGGKCEIYPNASYDAWHEPPEIAIRRELYEETHLREGEEIESIEPLYPDPSDPHKCIVRFRQGNVGELIQFLSFPVHLYLVKLRDPFAPLRSFGEAVRGKQVISQPIWWNLYDPRNVSRVKWEHLVYAEHFKPPHWKKKVPQASTLCGLYQVDGVYVCASQPVQSYEITSMEAIRDCGSTVLRTIERTRAQ